MLVLLIFNLIDTALMPYIKCKHIVLTKVCKYTNLSYINLCQRPTEKKTSINIVFRPATMILLDSEYSAE